MLRSRIRFGRKREKPGVADLDRAASAREHRNRLAASRASGRRQTHPGNPGKETSMPDQDPDKTQRTTVKTARAADTAADRTADAARAATDAGAGAAQQGAERLQGQMEAMLGTTSRASQEAARRASENLELMKRLAETMTSGVREASSEVVEWTRRASERQAEATRQITQARSLDDVLDIQNNYIRENLQSLLELSAKVSRLSADKANEASGHLDQDRR